MPVLTVAEATAWLNSFTTTASGAAKITEYAGYADLTTDQKQYLVNGLWYILGILTAFDAAGDPISSTTYPGTAPTAP